MYKHNIHIKTLTVYLLRNDWFLVGIFIVQLALLIFVRRVNLDEGWYLWASKLVYEDKILYRDFAYTQMPLLPYIYGFFGVLVSDGLLSGRILTALMGLGAAMLNVRTAAYLGGPLASRFTLVFLIVSFFANAHFAFTATYGLTAFLLAMALSISLQSRPGSVRNLTASVCASLAVSTRLSTLIVLPLFGLYLVLTSRDRRRGVREVCLGIALPLVLIILPFFLAAPEQMKYDILGFHVDRLLKLEWQLQRVIDVAGRTLLDFGIPFLLGIGGTVIFSLRSSHCNFPSPWRSTRLAMWFLAGMIVSIFIAHLIPRTTDSYYNSLQMPLVALLAGLVLAEAITYYKRSYVLVVAVGLVVLHGVHQIQALKRDNLLPLPLANQLDIVQDGADFLRTNAPAGSTLLTFDTHLALESGMIVPSGYEMSIFGYRPDWDSQEVRKFHVMNNSILRADLERGVDGVAMTVFDLEMLYGEREAILQTLQRLYRWSKTVEGFDPKGDELRIYLPPRYTVFSMDTLMDVQLADGISLVGFDWDSQQKKGKWTIRLNLYWHARTQPEGDYTVFAHLVDTDGRLVSGWDNPPCHNTCTTSTWRAGEYLRDEYILSLAEPLSSNEYLLRTGMYESSGGRRLPVLAGTSSPDFIDLTRIRLDLTLP